jgi:hypothetical protein
MDFQFMGLSYHKAKQNTISRASELGFHSTLPNLEDWEAEQLLKLRERQPEAPVIRGALQLTHTLELCHRVHIDPCSASRDRLNVVVVQPVQKARFAPHRLFLSARQ